MKNDNKTDGQTGVRCSARLGGGGSFDDDCVLHFATRYALGRRTGAVWIVGKVLKREWLRLRLATRERIQSEIRDAIKDGLAGDQCDVDEWQAIAELPPNARFSCREPNVQSTKGEN